MLTESQFRIQRERMVEKHLKPRGIDDPLILEAMSTVPRHQFVPLNVRGSAYHDGPLPIGGGQTISQPYIVALMTQYLNLQGGERVLEVGTGSGYQTAILCQIAAYVFTLERSALLADRAAIILSELGYTNLDIHVGDGSQGLPDMKPYHAIIVTAAAPLIPGPLASQLHPDGGRLVIPIGSRRFQELQIIQRQNTRFIVRRAEQVRFVPLLGRYGFNEAGSDISSVG
jgi:protein-L-isoaspartate(D-aspartate) O-methyltransferase